MPEPREEPAQAALEPEIALPYSEVTELGATDGPLDYKYLANALTRVKSVPHNKGKQAEIDEQIATMTKEAERPEGEFRYDFHDLYDANPIHKLTQDEKLHCIRTQPLPIVQKLFPNL